MSLSEFLGGHHLIDFHEASMRSRDVVDLLERFDLDVIYNFDRLEEGEPDTYTVKAAAEGFELRFDETQMLEVIWCHVQEPQPRWSDTFRAAAGQANLAAPSSLMCCAR